MILVQIFENRKLYFSGSSGKSEIHFLFCISNNASLLENTFRLNNCRYGSRVNPK